MTRSKRQQVTPAKRPQVAESHPFWWRAAQGYMRRPRLLRIIVAALFGVGITLLISPQVDNYYLTYFYSPDTRVLPSLLSTAGGVVMYAVGWRLTLSVEAVDHPPLRSIAWYLLIGLLVLVALLVLVIVGLITINLPT